MRRASQPGQRGPLDKCPEASRRGLDAGLPRLIGTTTATQGVLELHTPTPPPPSPSPRLLGVLPSSSQIPQRHSRVEQLCQTLFVVARNHPWQLRNHHSERFARLLCRRCTVGAIGRRQRTRCDCRSVNSCQDVNRVTCVSADGRRREGTRIRRARGGL